MDGHPSRSSLDLTTFNKQTRSKIDRLRDLLFSTCSDLHSSRYNSTPGVIDILREYLVRCYPQLKSFAPLAPILLVVEKALISASTGVDDILAWSMHLNSLAHRAHSRGTSQGRASSQITKQL